MRQHDQERREYPVEEDWNRSADPALVRIERHANRVANHHDADVHRPDHQQDRSEPPPRIGEKAAAAADVERDLSVEQDDDDLAGEERRISERAGKPFLPRRQKRSPTQCDRQLGEDAADEQREQHPQRGAVARAPLAHSWSANIAR
jgi:hypothetical protein